MSLSRRNIIVIGSGETGLDIAQQALEAGGNVSVSSRSGWLSVPKQLPNGVPLDIYITNMFEASFEHRWVDRSRLKWIVATFFIRLFFFLGTYFSLSLIIIRNSNTLGTQVREHPKDSINGLEPKIQSSEATIS